VRRSLDREETGFEEMGFIDYFSVFGVTVQCALYYNLGLQFNVFSSTILSLNSSILKSKAFGAQSNYCKFNCLKTFDC
jgi:hypothetical protein